MDVLQQRDSAGTVLTDLAPATGEWMLERDSLAYTPGQKSRVSVPQPSGGEVVLRELRANDSLHAAWVVVGSSQDECWQRARGLIEAFERVAGETAAGLSDLRLYWRPEGVPDAHAALFAQQGSADWTFGYSWATLTLGAGSGQGVLSLSATWAVLPYTW
jgi:hypothetical protein